jgi:hypothetical protein
MTRTRSFYRARSAASARIEVVTCEAIGIGGRHRVRIHSSYEARNAAPRKPLADRREPLLACSLTLQSATPMTRHLTSIDQAAACGVLAASWLGVRRSGSAGKPVHRRGGAANGPFAAAF